MNRATAVHEKLH